MISINRIYASKFEAKCSCCSSTIKVGEKRVKFYDDGPWDRLAHGKCFKKLLVKECNDTKKQLLGFDKQFKRGEEE